MSARSKLEVSWARIVPIRSTISLTRPDSSRAVNDARASNQQAPAHCAG